MGGSDCLRERIGILLLRGISFSVQELRHFQGKLAPDPSVFCYVPSFMDQGT